MRPTPRLQQAGYTFSECINIQLPFTLWYRKRPMTGDLSRQISRMFIYMSEVHIVFDKTWQLLESRKLIQFFWPFNGHIKTAEQQTTIQQYGDWYTGRCWVGCSSVLQFFSRYPAMGVHPLLLEWHSSAMRNNIWWFLKGLFEGINGWFRSGWVGKCIPIY